MPTAAEIASAAWEKEDRARRQREAAARRQREAAERRARTRAENVARGRLDRSVIPDWFPGVEWKFIETEDGRDIWKSGEGFREIKLAVLHKTKDGKDRLRVEFVRIKDWERRPYNNGLGPIRLEREVWQTVPVNTVAEVWAAKQEWDRITRIPDWA